MRSVDDIDNDDDPVDVCTLGMFIIDEIDYLHQKGDRTSIIGGAGTYVALGARLAASKRHAASVGWIVDVGSDFPSEFRSTLDSWGTCCLFREDFSRLTTRAWNGYGADEERAFKYLTPKVRLEAHSLPRRMLYSKVFHMVCSGDRCRQIVKSILGRREREATGLSDAPARPIFVWEPIPDLSTPSELESFWEAVRYVDIVSPNEGELAAYFGVKHMTDTVDNSITTVVDEVRRRGIGPDGNGLLIVRTGSKGCTLFSQEGSLQMRAYFLPDDSNVSSDRVVDPTGGGNTFLGGLCKALAGQSSPSVDRIIQMIKGDNGMGEGSITEQKKRNIAALVFGNVAASFAIEQPGIPTLSDEGGREVWNNEAVEDRVEAYITRERSHILEQRFL